jgi:hypothetical protein
MQWVIASLTLSQEMRHSRPADQCNSSGWAFLPVSWAQILCSHERRDLFQAFFANHGHSGIFGRMAYYQDQEGSLPFRPAQ